MLNKMIEKIFFHKNHRGTQKITKKKNFCVFVNICVSCGEFLVPALPD